MLYGTRKELNKRLKNAFGDTEKFALLVWTREAVMVQAQGMTEQEADQILALIGETGCGAVWRSERIKRRWLTNNHFRFCYMHQSVAEFMHRVIPA